MDNLAGVKELLAKTKSAVAGLEDSLLEKDEAFNAAAVENAERVAKDRVAIADLRAEIAEQDDYLKAKLITKAEHEAIVKPLKEKLEAVESHASQADGAFMRRAERYQGERRMLFDEIDVLKRKAARFQAKLDEAILEVVVTPQAENESTP